MASGKPSRSYGSTEDVEKPEELKPLAPKDESSSEDGGFWSSFMMDNKQTTVIMTMAFLLHDTHEAWGFPAYQRAMGIEPAMTVGESFQYMGPILVMEALSGVLAFFVPWGNDYWAVLFLLHPIMDNVWMSVEHGVLRAGSATAFGILLPLGLIYMFKNKSSIFDISWIGATLALIANLWSNVTEEERIPKSR